MARTLSQDPGGNWGWSPLNLRRIFSGIRSGRSPAIAGRSNVTRLPLGKVSATATRPVTVVGPKRSESTGAATAAVRHWATPNPAAMTATAVNTAAVKDADDGGGVKKLFGGKTPSILGAVVKPDDIGGVGFKDYC